MSGQRARERAVIPLGSLLVGLVFVGVWWLSSRIWWVVPAPGAVWLRLIKDLAAGDLTPHIIISLQSVVVAFAGSIILGVPVGVWLGLSSYWRKALESALLSTNAIPKIILLPVVLSVFGIGQRATMAMGLVIGVFPVIINVMSALKGMKPVYAKVGQCFGFNPWQMLTKVYLPAISLPFVAGTRMAFGLSVVGVILAELFAAKYGMGQFVRQSYTLGVYDRMTAGIVLLFVFALGGSLLIWGAEKRLRRLT